MHEFNPPQFQPDHQKSYGGQPPTQSTGDIDQLDRSTHPTLREILNTPWQLIGIKITFAMKVINSLSLSRWENWSARTNIANSRGRNE